MGMARTAPCSGVLLSECFYNEVSDTLSKCLILYLIIYVVIHFFYPVLMLMEDWGQVGCRRKRGALITKLETRGEQRMQKNQQKVRENSGSHTDGLSVVGIIRKPYSCDRENSSECDLKSEQRLKKLKKTTGSMVRNFNKYYKVILLFTLCFLVTQIPETVANLLFKHSATYFCFHAAPSVGHDAQKSEERHPNSVNGRIRGACECSTVNWGKKMGRRQRQ